MKGFAMQLPTNTKPMIWGAVIGAVACMIVGFSWGGWVTGGTARKDAATAVHDAVVVALAPICAERFRTQGDAPAQIAALAKASSWERGNIVEKSGYAVMPGSKTTDSDVARACAEMLTALPVPKT
jgi:alpha/beta superfamily hydrolase